MGPQASTGAGADLALAARSKADLEKTGRLVQAAGRRALVVPTDVTRYPDVEALVARTRSQLGRVDIVVNNSGVAWVKPLIEWTPEEWHALVDTNLHGVIALCRAAAPHLIAQGGGKVINVASMLAAVGLPGYTVYSATKGAIVAFTRDLAVKWARYGITVNAIAPGFIPTRMSETVIARGGQAIINSIPIGRIGTLEDLLGAVLCLVAPSSGYITGQVLAVDGGITAV